MNFSNDYYVFLMHVFSIMGEDMHNFDDADEIRKKALPNLLLPELFKSRFVYFEDVEDERSRHFPVTLEMINSFGKTYTEFLKDWEYLLILRDLNGEI